MLMAHPAVLTDLRAIDAARHQLSRVRSQGDSLISA